MKNNKKKKIKKYFTTTHKVALLRCIHECLGDLKTDTDFI